MRRRAPIALPGSAVALGKDIVARRLGILAHYDAQGEVKAYVRYYLAELRPLCERLVLVSNAALSDTERESVRPLVDELIVRENRGFDFAMWRAAIERQELGAFDELLLTNSSVFGPLSPLERLFDAMADRPCDFWGLTENSDILWHIQSYFLVFRHTVLHTDAFRQFWASVLPYRDKDQTIRCYEIGLTLYLLEAGFRGLPFLPNAAVFPPPPLDAMFRYKKHNLTSLYPDRLIDYGMPFVKIEVLRDNPTNLTLEPIRERMRRAGYPERLIEFDPRGPYPHPRLNDRFFRWLQRPLGRIVDRLAEKLLLKPMPRG